MYSILVAFSLFSVAFGHTSVSANHPHYGHITIADKIVCTENETASLEWLGQNNFHRCVNIISDLDLPACFYQQIQRANFTYQEKTILYLLNHSIFFDRPESIKCNTYMILLDRLHFITQIFEDGQKHFYPFSYIYLFTPSTSNVPQESLLYALNYGYNVYGVKNNIFNNNSFLFDLNFGWLKNLYTNRTLYTTETNKAVVKEFFGDLRTHPLFNTSITKNRPFRIAMRNCPPYVIVKDQNRGM